MAKTKFRGSVTPMDIGFQKRVFKKLNLSAKMKINRKFAK